MHLDLSFLDSRTLATLARTATCFHHVRPLLKQLKWKQYLDQHVSSLHVHVTFGEQQELILTSEVTIGKPNLLLLTDGLTRASGQPWCSFECQKEKGVCTIASIRIRLQQCILAAQDAHSQLGLTLKDEYGRTL